MTPGEGVRGGIARRRTDGSLSLALLLALSGGAASGGPLPTLPEAFGAGVAGAGGVGAGGGLFRIDVDLADYPLARCADDTAAVFFVRQASLPAHANKWVLYLQGGGECSSGQECAERWKKIDTPIGANKLSSDFAPALGMQANGIERISADNSFGSWNHVFFYYCSSDLWSGTQADFATSASAGTLTVPYRIHLLGARIFDAVIGTLRREHGPVGYLDGSGTPHVLPDLDDAAVLLLAGSSAGGAGVVSNADRLFETLTEGVAGCESGPEESCPLRFAAVVDAAYPPDTSDLDWSASGACSTEPCTWEKQLMESHAAANVGFWATRGDDSCATAHAGEPWRCELRHVLEHHLRSPLFVRMDVQDPLLLSYFTGAGLLEAGLPVDDQEFGERVAAQMSAFADLAGAAEEPRSSWLEPPGGFGPQCGDHESLRNTTAYFDVGVPAGGSGAPNTDAVLANWLLGASPSLAVESFVAPGVLSGCPATSIFEDNFETGDTLEWSASAP